MYQSFTLATLDAVENGDIVDLSVRCGPSDRIAIQHTQSGSPATATLVIYGSVDGVSFFDISGNIDASSNGLVFIVDKPVRYLRAGLTALSGGTAPVVTVQCLAVS